MADEYDDLRLARLGEFLESKAAAPAKKKPGKTKPVPPWMDPDNNGDDDRPGSGNDPDDDPIDEEDMRDHGSDEDSEDAQGRRKKPAKRGAKGLPHTPAPAGWTAKKPLPKQNTSRARRKQTVTSPRGHLARVQHNSRGTNVSMRTLPAPKGIKAKALPRGAREAGRPTVWGPQKQHVDITRARVATTGSDARVNAAAGRRSNGPAKPYGRGQAGGNGVTGGRGDLRAANPKPGNVGGGRGTRKVRHSGEMGEGAVWGRSGSAVIPHKPKNFKSLWDFSQDDLRSAMDVAAKAIRGVLAEHEAAED